MKLLTTIIALLLFSLAPALAQEATDANAAGIYAFNGQAALNGESILTTGLGHAGFSGLTVGSLTSHESYATLAGHAGAYADTVNDGGAGVYGSNAAVDQEGNGTYGERGITETYAFGEGLQTGAWLGGALSNFAGNGGIDAALNAAANAAAAGDN